MKQGQRLVSWEFALLAFFSLCVSADIVASPLKSNPDLFSPFEHELDATAARFGNNTDLILNRLNQMKSLAKSDDDLAALSAFQCEIFKARKELQNIDEVNRFLSDRTRENNSNYSLRAANELCLLYREEKTEQHMAHMAMAYHHARFAQSASLRFLVSSMYIEITGSQGRAQDAVDAARMALTIAQVNNDRFRQSLSLRSLAAIELDYGDKEAGLEYINQALELAQEFGNRQLELLYRINRATTLISMKRLMEARVAKLDAEKLAEELNREIPKEFQDQQINAFLLANSAELAYLEGDYSTARSFAEQLEAAAIKNNLPLLVAMGRVSFAIASVRLGQSAAIESHFNKGIQAFVDSKRTVEVRDSYEQLAEALASIGKYKEAYMALTSKNIYIAQIAKESRNHRAGELRETLKSSQREKENLALRDLNTRQRAEVESATLRLQRWWLFAALLALGLGWAAQMVWMAHKRNSSLLNLNKELDDQRLHDALTGLFNRRYLNQTQNTLWSRTLEQVARGRFSAILLIDADHFKRINDEHGHTAGDLALIEITRRLKLSVRETDLLVRWGGEEFLIYTDANNAEVVQNLAIRIMQEMRLQSFSYEDNEIKLSVSIGYVLLPLQRDGDAPFDLDESFKLVDAALYMAKTQGRNRAVGLCQINRDCRGRAQLLRELPEAWKSGEVDIVVTEGPP
jgi:diguanylate cyclase (GGDEF)-like protein